MRFTCRHFRTLKSADLLFYNENNRRFTYKPKRFTRIAMVNLHATTIIYMDFRNII
jgi:tricorn protease-like protein